MRVLLDTNGVSELRKGARCHEGVAAWQSGIDLQALFLPYRDSLIAATAAEHRLTVATRNVADFKALGVAVVNPWDLTSR